MRYLWPTKLNENPTALTRVGRLLHWIAVIAAVLVVLITVPIVWYYLTHPIYAGASGVNASLRLLAIAFPVAALIGLLGRGLRYIISRE